MMSSEILQRQKVCPLCGSNRRSRAVTGLARDKKPAYLLALAESFGIDFQELVGQLEDWQCETCRCVYVDPSLSREALNRLYFVASPIHNAGWSAFTQKLLGERAGEKHIDSIIKHVTTRGVQFGRYLEVGCPFSGFALTHAEAARVRQGFLNSFKDGDRYQEQARRRILRHSVRFQRVPQRFMAMYFRVWLSLHDFRQHRRVEVESSATTINSLSFLTEFSGSRWSLGCRAFGSSCLTMMSATLNANLVSMGQFRDLPDGYFDLAGIFNSLDHSDSPSELLALVAQKSKWVLVTVHTLNDAYLQHRFAFSTETIPKLCRDLGLQCNDLSGQIVEHSSNWMAYLIKSEK